MDLIVVPINQFAFALLGWTGTKVSLVFKEAPYRKSEWLSVKVQCADQSMCTNNYY